MQGSGSIKEGSMGSGGVVHMVAMDIFDNISMPRTKSSWSVQASWKSTMKKFGIYNEEVRDLLSDNSPTLQIKEDPVRGVVRVLRRACVGERFNEEKSRSGKATTGIRN
jgi:Kinesin motor domain